LKPGEVLLRAADFPADIGDGLEGDLIIEAHVLEETSDVMFVREEDLWCVAIAKKSRLKKAVSEQFRLKLEELTGRKWRTDEISKFVFHLETKQKGGCEVKQKSEVRKDEGHEAERR